MLKRNKLKSFVFGIVASAYAFNAPPARAESEIIQVMRKAFTERDSTALMGRLDELLRVANNGNASARMLAADILSSSVLGDNEDQALEAIRQYELALSAGRMLHEAHRSIHSGF